MISEQKFSKEIFVHFQGILKINRSSLLAALKFTAFPDTLILETMVTIRENVRHTNPTSFCQRLSEHSYWPMEACVRTNLFYNRQNKHHTTEVIWIKIY